MPKSAKKRRDKAADFTKARLKLGKEKKAPSNVIDTSFKARSIALPTQNITVAKCGGVPTTKRNLTIDDLLAHLRHYSPAVKKDALLGLIELLEAHWFLAEKNLSQLINQAARVIVDEDPGVRKQLLSFFSWMLPRISKEILVPHASTLLLFTASAQTHIFPEIRIDSLRFIVLFLEHIPEQIVKGWNSTRPSHGKRILEGFLGNLNAGTQHGPSQGLATVAMSSGVILSPTSKLVVLQSFSAFLRAGLSTKTPNDVPGDSGSPLHAWFMMQSFTTREAFSKRHYDWSNTDEFESVQNYSLTAIMSSWTIEEFEDVLTSSRGSSEGNSAEDPALAFLSRLSEILHPLLVSTFLEYAPLVFAPDLKASETETLMIVAASQIASPLYGKILGSLEAAPASSLLAVEALLGYMTPYFPFTSSKSRDMKFSQCIWDLNLIYCELTSLLVLCANPASVNPGRPQKPGNTLMTQVSSVSDYITKLLRSEEGTVIHPIPHSLTAGAYLALLPSIWAIINNSDTELSSHTTDLLRALLDHAVQTSSKASVKRLTIEFVARLSLLETDIHYRGAFHIRSSDHACQLSEDWLIHLPQVLWEIGISDPLTTEVILRYLLRRLQCRLSLISSKVISALVLRLVPYFKITHPVHGELPGPYCKVTLARLRRLCLDMAATLLLCGSRAGVDISEASGALLKAVCEAVAGTVEEEYWTHVYKTISSR